MVLFFSLTLSNILTRKTQETQYCKSLRPCWLRTLNPQQLICTQISQISRRQVASPLLPAYRRVFSSGWQLRALLAMQLFREICEICVKIFLGTSWLYSQREISLMTRFFSRKYLILTPSRRKRRVWLWGVKWIVFTDIHGSFVVIRVKW